MADSDPLRARLQTSLGAAYTLGRELGGGGMARVFVATDTRLERTVVVKVLAPDLAAGLSAERFAREVKLAAGLHAPHIVPVLADGVTADGLPYYTMPYVAGESLRARLAAGPVPLPEAVAVLRDVARALASAHGRGVVHRDVKPENVLLDAGGAVVTDFGIAKALSASRTQDAAARGTLTQLGTALGTPAYMAPEQAAGEPDLDARADLYAWGVVAYELLAGRHPFAGKTTAPQLIAAQIGEVPRPLRTVAPAVPPVLADVVTRCLAKDPTRRPASAAEVLAALDHSATGPARTTAPARRTRIGVAGGATALLLAGAGFAWATHREAGRRAADTPDAAASGSPPPTMLAVLPFENAGPAEQAVFADGLTDALTAKLGAVPGLGVIDRRSAGQYRQSTKPARQIGTELGVPYLLEGVVRWARDARGVWRAQVTPTLVDARAGTTRWTGAPEVLTPTDPFTAQGEIATHVAEALQLALRPAVSAGLRARMTDDPGAFAAYARGRALEDAPGPVTGSRDQTRRIVAEYARAVALDSTFVDAWGRLASMTVILTNWAVGDGTAEAAMRRVVARAQAHAPEHPLVLLALATERLRYDQDTTGVDALLGRAVAGARGDGSTLARLSWAIATRGHVDSAYAVARRAVALDPRSAATHEIAAVLATDLRRWPEARREADAMIALDSTDERAWSERFRIAWYRGDTLAMRQELARARPYLASLDRPSPFLRAAIAVAGEAEARGDRPRSPQAPPALGLTGLLDTVWYYNIQAFAPLRHGDEAGVRVYSDSVRTLLAGRTGRGRFAIPLLVYRAYAQAVLGDSVAARQSVASALAGARRVANRPDLVDVLEPVDMAAIYARLGAPDTAVRWLAAGLSAPDGWTIGGYAAQPMLRTLRGTGAFARLMREHPE